VSALEVLASGAAGTAVLALAVAALIAVDAVGVARPGRRPGRWDTPLLLTLTCAAVVVVAVRMTALAA
jgi:hypothetical protein